MIPRALSIGDRLPPASRRVALVEPGPAGWYALRVAPQREGWVEARLALFGVRGFHPVLTRTVVRKGIRKRLVQREIPGYVFARFPGLPVIHEVLAVPHVLGALTMQDGRWAMIVPEDLQALYGLRERRAEIEDAARAEAARIKAARALRSGARALFRGGPLSGSTCEVVEIAGNGDVRVRLRLFGADQVIAAQASDLVSLRKAS